MTDEMVAREALERKECWAFLAEEIRLLMASSPVLRARCHEMVKGGLGSLHFEMGLRGLLDGAARGLSEVLSELDGELEAPSCEGCESRMHRRGRRSLSPLSLLGVLELRRGYRGGGDGEVGGPEIAAWDRQAAALAEAPAEDGRSAKTREAKDADPKPSPFAERAAARPSGERTKRRTPIAHVPIAHGPHGGPCRTMTGEADQRRVGAVALRRRARNVPARLPRGPPADPRRGRAVRAHRRVA